VRTLNILLSIIAFGNSYAQTIDSALLEHKQIVYSISNNCYDSLEWFELKLINKAVENRINKVIREKMLSYKLDTNTFDIPDLQRICDDRELPKNEKLYLEYNVGFGVTYSRNQIFSCGINLSEYWGGGSRPYHKCSYFNFDLTNGEQFEFHDLILNDSVAVLDSLIILKLKKEESLRQVDESYYNIFRNQLKEVRFWIDGLGITLRFEGMSNEFFDQRWLLSELKPFVKKDGAMKKVYEKTN
jgi:hypothetical protein